MRVSVQKDRFVVFFLFLLSFYSSSFRWIIFSSSPMPGTRVCLLVFLKTKMMKAAMCSVYDIFIVVVVVVLFRTIINLVIAHF